MLKLRMKQLLALVLCGLLVQPLPLMSEPAPAPPGAVLGSVSSRGSVSVGEVQVPGMSALFSGDQVRTGVGSALIQYQEGVRVILGTDSLARFSSSRVELQKGQMSFSTNTGGTQFAASTLRIEPVSAKSAANVTLADHKATVAVTEGSLRVVDPSGAQLASLRAGEVRLFEEASAAAPSPAPPAVPAPAAPQIGGGTGTSRAWLLALGIGVVGASLGIAGLVRANDADSRADEAAADANQARATAEALQAQATALQTQVQSLRTQLTALQSQLGAGNAQLANLVAALAELDRLQGQLNDAQRQLSQLLITIASQGGVPTAAQLSQLQSLGGLISSLFQAVQGATTRVGQFVNSLIGVISGTRIP